MFLDPCPRCFRGVIGRIRAFRLPIHLEAKAVLSACLRCVTGSGTESSGADAMVMVLVPCRVVAAI